MKMISRTVVNCLLTFVVLAITVQEGTSSPSGAGVGSFLGQHGADIMKKLLQSYSSVRTARSVRTSSTFPPRIDDSTIPPLQARVLSPPKLGMAVDKRLLHPFIHIPPPSFESVGYTIHCILAIIFIFFVGCFAILHHRIKTKSKIIAVPNLHGHYAYIITVKTGLRKNAGTNAKIKMELCSKHLKSQEYLLKDHGTKQNIFSRGKETMFLVYSTVPLGELSHVLIIQEGHGVKGKWHLDSVIVSDPQADREWLFSCNKWLKPQRTSKEGPATHTLALADAGRTFCLVWSSILCFFRQYHRWIYPFFGSGQDSNKVLSRPLTLVMLFSAVGNSLLGNMLVETALLTISSQIAVELTANIFFFTFLINTIICLINCLCEIVLGNIRSEELCQDIFTGKSSLVQHKVVTNRNQRKAHHMEKLTKAQSWSASQVQHVHSKDSGACSFKSRVDIDSKQSSIFPPKSRSQIFYDHERKICGSIQRSRSSSEVYILSGNRNNNNTASCSFKGAAKAEKEAKPSQEDKELQLSPDDIIFGDIPLMTGKWFGEVPLSGDTAFQEIPLDHQEPVSSGKKPKTKRPPKNRQKLPKKDKNNRNARRPSKKNGKNQKPQENATEDDSKGAKGTDVNPAKAPLQTCPRTMMSVLEQKHLDAGIKPLCILCKRPVDMKYPYPYHWLCKYERAVEIGLATPPISGQDATLQEEVKSLYGFMKLPDPTLVNGKGTTFPQKKMNEMRPVECEYWLWEMMRINPAWILEKLDEGKKPENRRDKKENKEWHDWFNRRLSAEYRKKMMTNLSQEELDARPDCFLCKRAMSPKDPYLCHWYCKYGEDVQLECTHPPARGQESTLRDIVEGLFVYMGVAKSQLKYMIEEGESFSDGEDDSSSTWFPDEKLADLPESEQNTWMKRLLKISPQWVARRGFVGSLAPSDIAFVQNRNAKKTQGLKSALKFKSSLAKSLVHAMSSKTSNMDDKVSGKEEMKAVTLPEFEEGATGFISRLIHDMLNVMMGNTRHVEYQSAQVPTKDNILCWQNKVMGFMTNRQSAPVLCREETKAGRAGNVFDANIPFDEIGEVAVHILAQLEMNGAGDKNSIFTRMRQKMAVFPVVEDWSYLVNVWEDELSNYIQLSGEQYQLKDHVQASVQTVSLHSLEKNFDEDQHKPLKVTQDIGAQTGTSLLDLKLKQKKSGYVYGRNLTKTSSTTSVNHLREAIQVNLALVQRRQDAALGKLRANMTSDPSTEITASDEEMALTAAFGPSPYLSLGELVAKIIADDVNAGCNVNKYQADFPEEITEATLKDFTLGTTHGLLASFYDVCDVATEASQKAMQDFSKKLVATLVQLISAKMNNDIQSTAKRPTVKELEKDECQVTQCMDREVQYPHTLVDQVNNLMKQEMQDIRNDKTTFIKEVFNYHYVDSLISNAIIRAQFAVFHCAESKSQDLDWPDKEHVIAKAADLLKEDVLTFYDENWDECSDSFQIGLLSQNAEGDVFLGEQDLKVAIVNDAKMVAKSVATSVLKQSALCSDISCQSDSSVFSTDKVQFKEEFKDLRNLEYDLSLERRARATESWSPRRSLSLDSMKNPPGSSEATLCNLRSTSTLCFKSFENLGVLKRQPTWGELRADISSSLRFEDNFVTGTVDINDNSQVVQVNNTAELSPEVQDDECNIETSGPSAMDMTTPSSLATVYFVNEVMSTVSVKEDNKEEKDLKNVDNAAFPLCPPNVVDIDIEAALPHGVRMTTPVSATTAALMAESMTAPVPEVVPAEMTTPVTATYQVENEVTAQISVDDTQDLANDITENVFSTSSTSELSAIITEELDAAYSRDIQSCDISASVDDSVADVQDSGKQSASIVNDLPEDKYGTTEIIPTSALDSSLQGNLYDVVIQVEEDNSDENELMAEQSNEEYKPLSDKELLHLERMVKGEFKKSFPHWVKYIVFIFLFCSIMLSFSLTAIYGMSLPEDHVNHWLMLVGLSLLEDFFIFQPIKCFCVQFYFFLFPQHRNKFHNPII